MLIIAQGDLYRATKTKALFCTTAQNDKILVFLRREKKQRTVPVIPKIES
jgi:hypothetical protein